VTGVPREYLCTFTYKGPIVSGPGPLKFIGAVPRLRPSQLRGYTGAQKGLATAIRYCDDLEVGGTVLLPIRRKAHESP